MTVRRSLALRLLRKGMSQPDELSLKRSGWKQWWNSLNYDAKGSLKHLQQNLMDQLRFDSGISVENSMLMGEINQWRISNPTAKAVGVPTLMIHGYAASSMTFFRNFEQLSLSLKDVYAVDLPGNGLSKELPLSVDSMEKPDRVEFNETVKGQYFRLQNPVDEEKYKKHLAHYEDYYVDALERWRKENKLSKINLVGHSYGGYLTFKYSLKYPDNVHKLCLVSPLGVERSIFSIHNHLEPERDYEIQSEDPSKSNYSNKRSIPKLILQYQNKALRWMGPLGAKACWGYVNSSYGRVPSVPYREYVFQLVFGKGIMTDTSIRIFNQLFSRSLLAYDPIMDSLDKVKVSKLMLVYGEHDWMNKVAGRLAIDEFNSLRKSYDGTFDIVSRAGHNLVLDNPSEFNSKLVEFLRD
ncbi:Ict1/Ecm18 [Kluyveromyces lactis]|nr:Ict1/Ecm18 [Kluyveromyces lactis]